nr:hypothetical protein [Bacteriovoracaceae bacterium]
DLPSISSHQKEIQWMARWNPQIALMHAFKSLIYKGKKLQSPTDYKIFFMENFRQDSFLDKLKYPLWVNSDLNTEKFSDFYNECYSQLQQQKKWDVSSLFTFLIKTSESLNISLEEMTAIIKQDQQLDMSLWSILIQENPDRFVEPSLALEHHQPSREDNSAFTTFCYSVWIQMKGDPLYRKHLPELKIIFLSHEVPKENKLSVAINYLQWTNGANKNITTQLKLYPRLLGNLHLTEKNDNKKLLSEWLSFELNPRNSSLFHWLSKHLPTTPVTSTFMKQLNNIISGQDLSIFRDILGNRNNHIVISKGNNIERISNNIFLVLQTFCDFFKRQGIPNAFQLTHKLFQSLSTGVIGNPSDYVFQIGVVYKEFLESKTEAAEYWEKTLDFNEEKGLAFLKTASILAQRKQDIQAENLKKLLSIKTLYKWFDEIDSISDIFKPEDMIVLVKELLARGITVYEHILEKNLLFIYPQDIEAILSSGSYKGHHTGNNILYVLKRLRENFNANQLNIIQKKLLPRDKKASFENCFLREVSDDLANNKSGQNSEH